MSLYCSCTCWTPVGSGKGPYKIWSVSPSVLLLSFCLSGYFLELNHWFLQYWHGARNPYEVVCDRAEYFEKPFFGPKIGEMGQKQGFLNLTIWSLIFGE